MFHTVVLIILAVVALLVIACNSEPGRKRRIPASLVIRGRR